MSCACGCKGTAGTCAEVDDMDESQQLMSMPSLGPTDGEPCRDCDDDNFALDEFGGAAIPARRDPPPSDFDSDDQHVWKIHELRRYVRAVLLSSR